MKKILLLIFVLLLVPTIVNAEATKTKDSVVNRKNSVPQGTLYFHDLQSKVFLQHDNAWVQLRYLHSERDKGNFRIKHRIFLMISSANDVIPEKITKKMFLTIDGKEIKSFDADVAYEKVDNAKVFYLLCEVSPANLRDLQKNSEVTIRLLDKDGNEVFNLPLPPVVVAEWHKVYNDDFVISWKDAPYDNDKIRKLSKAVDKMK